MHIQKMLQQVSQYVSAYAQSPKHIVGALLLVTASLTALFFYTTESKEVPVAVETAPLSFMLGTTPSSGGSLTVSGTIEPINNATLSANASGRITSFPFRAGNTVTKDTVIATIESGAQAAAVASARASLQQAQANLEKVQNGTRSEQLTVLAEQVTSAQTGIATSQTTARNALLGAYAAVDNAFPGGVDVLYSDPTGVNPQITLTSTNYGARIAAQNDRVQIGEYLKRHAANPSTTDAALDAELIKTEQELLFIKDTLDKILQVLAGAVASSTVTQSQIDGYTTVATGARSSVLGALSSLSSAKASLASARTALTVAQQQQSEGVTGARPEDIKTAQAAVAQAQAGLYSAQAQFANTRITAPFSGTISDTFVSLGEHVSFGTPIVQLSSAQLWKIVAHAPLSLTNTIVPGTKVNVSIAGLEGTFDGVVSHIIPAVGATRALRFEVHVQELPNSAHTGAVATVYLAQEHQPPTSQEHTFAVPHQFIGYDYQGAYVRTHEKIIPVHIVERTTEYSVIESASLLSGESLLHP